MEYAFFKAAQEKQLAEFALNTLRMRVGIRLLGINKVPIKKSVVSNVPGNSPV
jgi:hypothetical protein